MWSNKKKNHFEQNKSQVVDFMDWNLKASSWDLTEFEQGAIPSIDAFDRSTNFGDHRNGGGFSIDLKLGGIGNSSDESMNKWKQPGVSKMESSPSVSTKRARGANNGTQAVSCLVDGCNSDLSTCRDYHRRHKVCELHSKTPQVTIGGLKQRFCQQCSRYKLWHHVLSSLNSWKNCLVLQL